ncbi:hypothetical protein KA517_05135 [Candidatus Gracilibacteria bacterium]|nr:hypothetical protein [Candidatus Gracilibacteria bacterium]
MEFMTPAAKIVTYDDEDDDDLIIDEPLVDDLDTDTATPVASKKAKAHDDDDLGDDDENSIVCLVCGEVVEVADEEEVYEGAVVICPSCSSEMEVTGFHKDGSAKIKLIEEQK